MTDRATVYRSLSHAAWGYFLLFFNFNLNTVDILPNFAGWLLLLSSCTQLAALRRDLALLRPLCMILAAWDGVDWLLSWGGSGLEGRLLPLSLLVSAASLYFHYQFLTDMAALAEAYQPQGDDLDRRLRSRRTVLVVASTAVHLLSALSGQMPQNLRTAAVIGPALLACVAALLTMSALFALRRCLREEKTL